MNGLFSNGSVLGIAKMRNIYSATCNTQINIQKVIIKGHRVLLKFSNDYCCKLC